MRNALVKNNSALAKTLDKICPFFESRLFPFVIAVFVLAGHVTGLEFYFNIPIILSTAVALLISPTIKPFIITMLAFIYQIPLKHTPANYGDLGNSQVPDYNPEYYTQPYIFITIIILSCIIFPAIIYRFVRFSVPKINPKSPLFYSLSLFSLALMTGGVFSEKYTISSLVYSAVQVVVFFVFFYLIYHGLSDIPRAELLSYLCYISLLIAMILVGEIIFMYATYETIFTQNGEIIKEAINLGWGLKNPIGFSLAVLLPVLALGAMSKSRLSLLYFAGAIITWLATFLTMSRNAMLFSTIVMVVILIIACFFSKNKKTLRIASGITIALGIAVAFLMFDKIGLLFDRLLKNDVSDFWDDNGRYALWKMAFYDFLSSPIFGVGFFSFGDGSDTVKDVVSFLPTMPHNTFMILLSATGILGLVTYCYYRVDTIIPLIKRPSLEKTMLLVAIINILSMGIVDNFVFYISPMFYYVFVLAVAMQISRPDDRQNDTPMIADNRLQISHGSEKRDDSGIKARNKQIF